MSPRFKKREARVHGVSGEQRHKDQTLWSGHKSSYAISSGRTVKARDIYRFQSVTMTSTSWLTCSATTLADSFRSWESTWTAANLHCLTDNRINTIFSLRGNPFEACRRYRFIDLTVPLSICLPSSLTQATDTMAEIPPVCIRRCRAALDLESVTFPLFAHTDAK